MKSKPKNLKSTLLITALAVVLAAAAGFWGLGTTRSALRIGYVGSAGLRSWTGSYAMLDGNMRHILYPGDAQKVLHVEVVTEGGSISVEMKDADGSVIFEEDQLATSAFDVEVSGKTVIRIKAERHKGSFRVELPE